MKILEVVVGAILCMCLFIIAAFNLLCGALRIAFMLAVITFVCWLCFGNGITKLQSLLISGLQDSSFCKKERISEVASTQMHVEQHASHKHKHAVKQ